MKLFNTVSTKEHVFKPLLSYNKEDIENIYSIYPNIFENTRFYPLGMDATGNYVYYDLLNNKFVLFNHNTYKAEEIINYSHNVTNSKQHKKPLYNHKIVILGGFCIMFHIILLRSF